MSLDLIEQRLDAIRRDWTADHLPLASDIAWLIANVEQLALERAEALAEVRRVREQLERERKTEMWVTSAWIPKEQEDRLLAQIAQLKADYDQLAKVAWETYWDQQMPSRWFEDGSVHRKVEHDEALKAELEKAGLNVTEVQFTEQ